MTVVPAGARGGTRSGTTDTSHGNVGVYVNPKELTVEQLKKLLAEKEAEALSKDQASEEDDTQQPAPVRTANRPALIAGLTPETEEQDEIAVISRKTAQALNVSSGYTILLSDV